MQILSQPLPLVLYVILLAAHFLPLLFSEKLGKILRYANITLHIILFALLLWTSVPMEETALLYLLSLLVYLGSALVDAKFHPSAADREVEK